MTDQQTMQINPVAALRAASGRLDALDAYYINRVKILENDKLTLEARLESMEHQISSLQTQVSQVQSDVMAQGQAE